MKKLIEIASNLDIYDEAVSINVLEVGKKFPFLSGIFEDSIVAGKIARVFLSEKIFEVYNETGVYKIPFGSIVKNEKLHPIDFAFVRPYNSIFQNSECESLAARILHFTESWENPLTWEAYYETMTQRDKNVSSAVKRDFDRVMPYVQSPVSCALFSENWAWVLESFNNQNQ
jgi:hypothetical protein